ncbi:acyl carrier protein [Bacteroidales bacterium KA00251]|nr:acyl carrier protein [Bacteroidales bacterium KA00251]
MTQNEIQEKVVDVIVDKLNVEPSVVTMDANFRTDLSADSLDTVEIIMALESEFNITIPDEDAQSIETVGQAVSYVESHI